MSSLKALPKIAADYIDAHGWTQNVERTADGRACLTGALRSCEPQPGDWLIARAVFRRLGNAENWNDDAGRTKSEVVAALRTVEITDAELEETFGPQWEAAVALIRTASTLSWGQGYALDDERPVARDVALEAAQVAAWGSAREFTFGEASNAAGDAAWAAVGGVAGAFSVVHAWGVAWDAARDAAKALVLRDLIGSHGFTQYHYNRLVAPWAAVAGKVHPDDQDR